MGDDVPDMTHPRHRLVAAVVAYLSRLRFPTLFVLTLAVFAVDTALPDGLPFLDEILLGLAAALLGSWKRQREERHGGR